GEGHSPRGHHGSGEGLDGHFVLANAEAVRDRLGPGILAQALLRRQALDNVHPPGGADRRVARGRIGADEDLGVPWWHPAFDIDKRQNGLSVVPPRSKHQSEIRLWKRAALAR